MQAAPESVSLWVVATRSRQESLVVMVEYSVALASAAALCATPAELNSVQVTRYAGSHLSTKSAGAELEEEVEVAVVAPELDGQGLTVVVDAVAVAAPA